MNLLPAGYIISFLLPDTHALQNIISL